MPKYGNIGPALKRFLESFICLPVMFVLASKFKIEYLYDPEYADETVVFKVFFLIGCMHVTIARLFAAFGLMEANLIASGISYRAKRDKVPEEYNSIRHVDMYAFETSRSAAECVINWNMCTNNWLKYYVQLRLIDRSLPREALQVIPFAATFIFSAVWHGIDLGYFAFFIFLCFNALIAKLFSKTKVAAAIMKVVPWPVLIVPIWIWNFYQISYSGMAFILLVYYKFNPMHAAFGYFLHWAYPVLTIIVLLLPKVKSEKQSIKKVSGQVNSTKAA